MRVPAFRPEPEAQAIREAAALLASARKPIIVAGGGVIASEAQREVVALAEKLGIPIATSLNGRETVLDNHPLAVGVAGTYSRACANRAVYEADLVLFIGSHTGGQLTVDWRIPAPGTRTIQIDIDPQERTEQIADVLSGLQPVGDPTAVPGGEVEEAVRTEADASAIVSAGRPGEQDRLRRRIRLGRIELQLRVRLGLDRCFRCHVFVPRPAAARRHGHGERLADAAQAPSHCIIGITRGTSSNRPQTAITTC